MTILSRFKRIPELGSDAIATTGLLFIVAGGVADLYFGFEFAGLALAGAGIGFMPYAFWASLAEEKRNGKGRSGLHK